MKTKISLGILFLLLMAMVGCDEKQQAGKGRLELSIGGAAMDEQLLKSLDVDTGTTVGYSYYLMISVETTDGLAVFDDYMVPLTVFGNGFLSPSIDMEAGFYRLTKLYIISSAGDVVMASPRQNSDYAYLVNNPLPIDFSIQANEVSHLSPEVLAIGDATARQFGYAEFDITVVNPLVAYVAVTNSMSANITGYVGATVYVTSSDGWSYKFLLKPEVNKLYLREGGASYTFDVYSPNGVLASKSVSVDELMNSTFEAPIIIDLENLTYHQMVFQPSASDGVDATIIDLKPYENYGNNAHFEASYVSEPILTVMRTTNSLIHFDALGALPKSSTIKKITLTLAIDWNQIVMPANSPDILYWPRGVLKQIVEPWDEDKVTWSNQPKTVDANQVYVDIDPSLSTIYHTFDVTSLFVPYAEIAAPNYGMMLSVTYDKGYLGELRFGSSDHADSTMHPKLTVYYALDNDSIVSR